MVYLKDLSTQAVRFGLLFNKVLKITQTKGKISFSHFSGA